MFIILYRLSVYFYKDFVFSNIDGMRFLYYNFFLFIIFCFYIIKLYNLYVGCKGLNY